MNVDRRHTIFVLVVNEPSMMWKPVEALAMSDDTYKIISANPDPQGQKWQFVTGNIVRCKQHTFMDGSQGMVAVERIEFVDRD